ncbi:MAG: MFS transporter [Dehalococcoidales bacterium]|nr:MFS transporter [Dehalococcoidales bacterium]
MSNQKVLNLGAGEKPRFFYGYIVGVAAFLIQLLVWGTYNTFGVFFKPMSSEFGWTRAMTSGPRSLCFLLIGLVGIIVGRLNDRFGPRLVMTVCGLFLGLGYLLMSQVEDIWHFYLFYGVVIALGMSGSDISLLSTLARWFVKKRGMMTGIIKAGAGMGMLIMPLVANWLVSNYDWRTSYIVIGFVVLVFSVLAAQFLRRDPGQKGLLPDGDKAEGKNLNLEATRFSLKKAIHTRQFWILSAIYFLFVLCAHTLITHIYPHVVDLGIAEATAANILATIGGASIAGRFIMGSASDRVGNKLTLIVTLAMLGVALFWLLVAKEAWMLYTFAALYGFAHGSLFTLISPIVAELFGLSSHGVIFGTVTFIGTVGGTIGPVMAGYIFDVTSSYQLGFIILAATSVIGIMLASLLRPIGRRGEN